MSSLEAFKQRARDIQSPVFDPNASALATITLVDMKAASTRPI